MITVVEFRAKQATGSLYMLTDKFYTNYFFIRIDLDWLEHPKGGEFLVFKVIFLRQKSGEFVYFFSLKNIKLGEELLLGHFLIFFIFKVLYFLRLRPIFGELQSIQINFDKEIIGL